MIFEQRIIDLSIILIRRVNKDTEQMTTEIKRDQRQEEAESD